jgi:tetratricopeptide (TPR) repeat protein
MSANKKVSVRAHTRAYLSAAAAFCFAAAFFSYIGQGAAALAAIFAAVTAFPLLAFRDRIVFDGKRLSRTGILWRLLRYATSQPLRIRPRSIIHVETEAIRALRRGSNISYLYQTSLHGTDMSFRIGSGRGYRAFIETVLPLIEDGCLDVRSVELRDHFVDAATMKAHARKLKIPRSDILDVDAITKSDRRVSRTAADLSDETLIRSDDLRKVANELRANGRLVQAVEAFRRAIRLTPRNARLIYEFARCIQSLASAKRDAGLNRKAQAMLRLAELRSSDDTDLLTRVGETYFSMGEWRRAELVFKRAADSGKAGYRIFRGLGELALRDGKIAHAINHFARSAEVAEPRPLFRWARSEAEYLRRINDDDEYMEVEIGRVNLFDSLESVRRTSTKVFCFGLLVIVSGLISDTPLIAHIGWAVAGIALILGLGTAIFKQLFAARIPFEIVDKER